MPDPGSTYLPPGLPAPRPSSDGLDLPYWTATREHRLVVQRCAACGGFQWTPEWICHRCLSYELGWEEIEPTGAIYSWERVWNPSHPAVAAAVPYLIVLVELSHAGGIRMIGNLLGDPHEDVVIGASVEAVFEDHASEQPYTLVQWKLA
jgi:uncharacterized OB-fold protein